MIVVASTIAPWKAGSPEGGDVAWMKNIVPMVEQSPEPVTLFLALETDNRDVTTVYRNLLTEVGRVDGELGGVPSSLDKHPNYAGFVIWRFQINDGATEVDSGNRLVRICTGRNLAHEFAMRERDASHILFLDTDIEVQDADCIGKLLEVGRPTVGGHVPNYGLTGPEVPGSDGKLQRHWNTAGFLMLNRDAFRAVRWGYDLDKGLTDDPWTQGQLVKLGFPETVVRHDVIGVHVEALVPVEQRPVDKKLRF